MIIWIDRNWYVMQKGSFWCLLKSWVLHRMDKSPSKSKLFWNLLFSTSFFNAQFLHPTACSVTNSDQNGQKTGQNRQNKQNLFFKILQLCSMLSFRDAFFHFSTLTGFSWYSYLTYYFLLFRPYKDKKTIWHKRWLKTTDVEEQSSCKWKYMSGN